MTDEQFERLLEAINLGFGMLANIHAIEAATIVLQKIESLPDSGAQATLEMLCDYFTQSAKGEQMKFIPRQDLMPGKKA